MSSKISNNVSTKIFGAVLGALIVSIFATLQQTIVFGSIKLEGFLIPIFIGSLSGFLIANWFGKLHEAKQEIELSHNRLKLVLEGTEVGLWDWNPKTNEISFDKEWCKLLGYTLEEVEQTFSSWEDRVHPDDLAQCYVDIKNHIDGKTEFYNNIHRMQHKDGHWVYILDRGQIIERDSDKQPTRFTGTHTDISYLKEIEHALEESNKKLKQLSLIDGLTGLHNRRSMEEHLLQEWGHWQRNQSPFSVLMIDIDFFKQFNDIYGHIEGDECLKQVAKVLQSNIKRTNDIAARFGGEEFLIILSSINHTEALIIAQEIHNAIARLAIPHKGSEIGSLVTLSIGVNGCDSEQECDSFHTILEGADTALYKAKQAGRNRSVTYSHSNL